MPFQCKENCGECCEDGMIFNKQFFEENKENVKRKIMVVLELKDNMVYPATFDRFCPFLREDYKCAIYENRTDLCKKFGVTEHMSCPYIDTDGNPRSKEETERIHLEQFKTDDAFNLMVALAIPDESKDIDTKEIDRMRRGVLMGDPFWVMAASAIFGEDFNIKKKGEQKTLNVPKEKYERVMKLKEEIDKERLG